MDKLVKKIQYLTKWSLDYSEVGRRVSERTIELPDEQAIAIMVAYLEDRQVSYSVKDNYILIGSNENLIVTLSNKYIVGKEVVISYAINN